MASQQTDINILVMVCGSVAAIKLPELVEKIAKLDGSHSKTRVDIRVVTTDKALHFFDEHALKKRVKLYKDVDEWSQWSQIGDEVLHIELRKWATIGVISPLDANTLAKISAGICDNLLTCVVRAWDLTKPLLFAPAMNVHMWTHPITNQNISKLLSFGYTHIEPIEKRLACGDIGLGAMAAVDTIVENINDFIVK